MLDSNVAIQFLNGKLDLGPYRESGTEVFLCLPVVGELFYGAEKSARAEANRARVASLLELCPLVPHDLETARAYALIKAQLKGIGRPIPENDLWIAAAALRHGLTLATRDPHFDGIAGLQVEPW